MKWLMLATLIAVAADWTSGLVVITKMIPMEKSFYELECPHAGELKYWLLHGKGDAFFPTETLIEEENITVYRNGSIIFKSIKVEHAGVHLCVRENQGTVTAHPVPLEVRPQPPSDLWGAMYRGQFLTGLIAALVCFMLFTVSCFVYNKRWKPEGKESDTSPIVENGYDNPVMVGEDDSTSTKM